MQKQIPIWLGLLEVGAVSLIVLGAFFDLPLISGFSLVIICAYWIVAKSQSTTAISAQIFADKVYFVGYQCTILGIICIGIKIGLNPQLLETPEKVVQLGAVSLASTIVALFCMGRLKDRAEVLSRNETVPDPVDRMVQFFNELEKRLEKSELARIQTMMKVFDASDFAKTLSRVGAEIDAGANGLKDLRKLSKSSSELIEGLTENVSELNDQVKVLAGTYKKYSPGLEALAHNVTDLSNLHVVIQNLIGSIEKFDKIVSSSKSNTESFSEKVLELKDLGKITAQIASLSSAVEIWLRTVDKNGQRLVDFAEQTGKLQTFGESLSE